MLNMRRVVGVVLVVLGVGVGMVGVGSTTRPASLTDVEAKALAEQQCGRGEWLLTMDHGSGGPTINGKAYLCTNTKDANRDVTAAVIAQRGGNNGLVNVLISFAITFVCVAVGIGLATASRASDTSDNRGDSLNTSNAQGS
jgi:hypothetical protein